jgi:hypothetical protein
MNTNTMSDRVLIERAVVESALGWLPNDGSCTATRESLRAALKQDLKGLPIPRIFGEICDRQRI